MWHSQGWHVTSDIWQGLLLLCMDCPYYFPPNRPPIQLVSFLPTLHNTGHTSSPLLSACVYIIMCLVPLLEAVCLLMLVCGLYVYTAFTHSILQCTFHCNCDVHWYTLKSHLDWINLASTCCGTVNYFHTAHNKQGHSLSCRTGRTTGFMNGTHTNTHTHTHTHRSCW